MRAVNLIPAEERRGAGGAGGRTAGAAYVLLGALVLIVGMLFAYATTTRSVNDKRAELARVERAAAASEAQAAALAPYTQFSALRTARVATVQSIADSRFDWAHAMHELGRTLPRDITLVSLTGTVSPGAASGGVSLRAAYAVPAIELTGCAPGQAAIPPLLASLRQVDGVRRVALQQSVKGAAAGAAAPAAPGAAAARVPDCARNFQAVIFYDPKPAPAAPAAAAPGGTIPAAGAIAPAQNVNGGAK